MVKKEKLYIKALESPQNIRFNELCKLAEQYGFELKKNKGGHEIYKHPTLGKMLNFQPDRSDNSKAKPYQVRQLTDLIDEYNLVGD